MTLAKTYYEIYLQNVSCLLHLQSVKKGSPFSRTMLSTYSLLLQPRLKVFKTLQTHWSMCISNGRCTPHNFYLNAFPLYLGSCDVVRTFEFLDEKKNVGIQMKAIERYFPEVLFIMLYNMRRF